MKVKFFIRLSIVLLLLAITTVVLIKVFRQRNESFHFPEKNRTQVSFSKLEGKNVMVVLAIGQSNAANASTLKSKSTQKVYNFYNGKLYLAEDPMLGATGKLGSVWPRLGDKLIKLKMYDSVVFITAAVHGTGIAEWGVKGERHSRITDAISSAKKSGLSITHVFWHQGETDAHLNTSKQQYQKTFFEIVSSIRQQKVLAPIFICVATRCFKQKSHPEIQKAQRGVVDYTQGIYQGPNTDQLGLKYRRDDCHFNDIGLEAFSELWIESLLKYKSLKKDNF